MSDQTGVAIIGCGMMGQAHADAWAERDERAILAVYDPIEDRAAKLAAKHGASMAASCEEAIQTDGVSIVSVCTPVCFHPEISIAATKAGKHVLCEKPIALTLDEAEAMDAAAKQAGVQMAVSYQYRWRSRYQLYRQLVESGALAGPIFARFVDVREVRPKTAMHRKSMNGGPVIDMTGHFFDLVRFITGAEPETVFATGHTFGQDKERLAGINDLAIDASEIQVRYGGGHTASVFVHWGLPEGSTTYSNEYLATAKAVVRPDEKRVIVRRGKDEQAHDLADDPKGPAGPIAALLEAIGGRPSPGVRASEGRTALAVSLAALESIATGRAVGL